MRLLHVNPGNLFGGIEVALVEVAAAAGLEPSLEHEFAVCYEGGLARALEEARARVHRLAAPRLRNPFSVVRARRSLETLLATSAFDACVCHSPWSLAVFGPVARRRCRRLVLYVHGRFSPDHWLDRRASRTRPDLLICNSKFTRESAERMFPGVPAEVVYYALRPRRLEGDRASTRQAIREALNTPPSNVVILQVARMEEPKGHRQLLEALGSLSRLDGWTCWFAGGAQRPVEERYLSDLKDLARRLGIADRVVFLGARRDVAALLSAADVFCHPNTGPEGFGIVFIEALDAGVPVVTTALGGGCEIVDESCGMLVAPGDVKALAAALARLIEDSSLRARLGASGPPRARALTDPARQISRLAAVLGAAVQAT